MYKPAIWPRVRAVGRALIQSDYSQPRKCSTAINALSLCSYFARHAGCQNMKLLPLDKPELFEQAASWLARKENHQWLDFGNGRPSFTPALLRIMAQRETHFLRLYTSDHDDVPIGILGLNSVDRVFKTATFWGTSGDKSFRNRGYSTLASAKFLALAFRDLGLHAINTWAVDRNPSIRIIVRLGFRFIGRQRQCHYIDGRLCDRLMFDLLASECREPDAEWRRRVKRPQQEADTEERQAQPG